ncbi:MAG TPA: hypothetical protein ENI23_14275 [bacterium]|nr:hypothetical protein [bacterium]
MSSLLETKTEEVEQNKDSFVQCYVEGGREEFAIKLRVRTKFGDKILMNLGFTKGTIKEQRNLFKRRDKSCNSIMDEWTPESAYILGYILGDGALVPGRNKWLVRISSTDNQVMEDMAKLFGLTLELCPREDGKDQVRLNIWDYNTVLKIKSYGISHRKSIEGCNLKLPEGNYNHFVRGLFDSDGCISISKRGYYRISIAGHPSYMLSKDLYITEHWNQEIRNSLIIRYTDRIDVIRKFGIFLYEGSTIHINRKRNRFKEIPK